MNVETRISREAAIEIIPTGAVLGAEKIPISTSAHAMNDGRSPLEHALADGEDFELVFALPAFQGEMLLRTQPIAGITLSHLGECVEAGLWLEENGQRVSLEPQGYVHEFE